MNNKSHGKIAFVLLTAGLLVLSGCGKNKDTVSSAVSSTMPNPASSTVQSAVASSQNASASSAEPTGAVIQSAKADESYLDDAVFIGDSVSLKLKNFVTAHRKTNAAFFGKAQF